MGKKHNFPFMMFFIHAQKLDKNKMCLWNTNAPETAIFWEM